MTYKQTDVVKLIKDKALRKDLDGKYHYPVSTNVRRSGTMYVSEKEIKTLINRKYISDNDLNYLK